MYLLVLCAATAAVYVIVFVLSGLSTCFQFLVVISNCIIPGCICTSLDQAILDQAIPSAKSGITRPDYGQVDIARLASYEARRSQYKVHPYIIPLENLDACLAEPDFDAVVMETQESTISDETIADVTISDETDTLWLDETITCTDISTDISMDNAPELYSGGEPDRTDASSVDREVLERECKAAQRNSVRIRITPSESQVLPVGTSKFGGEPDFPADWHWPTMVFKLSDYGWKDETQRCRPLSLIMQINLADVHAADLNSELPAKGMLYIFYELEYGDRMFENRDCQFGCARVMYYPGEVSSLKRQSFPKDLDKKFRVPEQRLSFVSELNMPFPDDFPGTIPDDDATGGNQSWYELYDETVVRLGCKTSEQIYESNEPIHKLLGWCDLIQGSALSVCSNDLQSENEWCLLFQLDSIYGDSARKTFLNSDFETCFGDAGRLYFCISKEDLKEERFEKAQVIFQCY